MEKGRGFENKLEEQSVALETWKKDWQSWYKDQQKTKFREVLNKYGVVISENECDQHFNSINILSQSEFEKKIREIEDCSEDEAEKIANKEWGFLDAKSNKIYINPVKQDGRIIPANGRIVPHEVLHLSSTMLNADQETIRSGMITDEKSRRLGEIIINAIDTEIAQEYVGSIPPPPGHEFLNVLRGIIPFELWVRASFTNKDYELLQKEVEERLGQDGFELICLLCKYNLWYELVGIISKTKDEINLPEHVETEDKEKIMSIVNGLG